MFEDHLFYWMFPAGLLVLTVKYLVFLFDLLRIQRQMPENIDVLRSYSWVIAFGGFAVLPGLTVVMVLWIFRYAGQETGVEGVLLSAAAMLLGFLLWVFQCSLATTCRHFAWLRTQRGG